MQEQQAPPAPVPPAPPDAPIAPVAPGAAAPLGGGFSIKGASPADVYQALLAQRRVLVDQLESLEEQRGELSSAIEERPGAPGRQGLEERIGAVDQRIAEVGQQLAASEREVARVAGIPGAAVEPPSPPEQENSYEAVAIVGVAFTTLVLFPLTIAHARRIWRRSAKGVSPLPGDVGERFTRLEQAVESVAIEVERISEGQRFVTRLMSEGRGGAPLGAGAAQPIEVKGAQQPEPAYRGSAG